LKRQYIITAPADCDINSHFSYIDQQNHAAAIRFLQAAEASCKELTAMPELGQRQQFRRESLTDLRAWQVRGFENFVIYYRPIEDGIEVVRVLHAARDIAAILDDPG
jgi:toxin ParE1/3/4